MLLLFLLFPVVLAGHLETLYSWTSVDFNFSPESLRGKYLSEGKFIPKNNLVIDVDVWTGSEGEVKKVFVTMPKSKAGVPVTIATVTNLRRNNTPLLQPYPDWSWHKGDCDGIISVFRTHVDKCGRLWVVDSGVVDIFINPKRKCSPQILVFDLHTDKLVKRFRIPDSLLDANSLLLNIAVDTRKPDCSDAFAYVVDVLSYKLIVYDSVRDKSWRVAHRYMYPYPQNELFLIDGKKFTLKDGLFGVALGPLQPNGDRALYFHSMASVRESWVPTSVIRNSSLFLNNPQSAEKSFHVFEATRSSQSAAEDMTDSGVLIYSLAENAIGCWNSHLPFEKQNLEVIAKDDVKLQFQSGLKVYGDKVFSLSCRFQNYILNQVPDNEINYRVNVGKISDLIRGTRCAVTKA